MDESFSDFFKAFELALNFQKDNQVCTPNGHPKPRSIIPKWPRL
jgi:hypothetical protein